MKAFENLMHVIRPQSHLLNWAVVCFLVIDLDSTERIILGGLYTPLMFCRKLPESSGFHWNLDYLTGWQGLPPPPPAQKWQDILEAYRDRSITAVQGSFFPVPYQLWVYFETEMGVC